MQAAHQRVLDEVEAAHATKHATLVDFDRNARAYQANLTAVATRATEAQRQLNLQVLQTAMSACHLHLALSEN